MGPLAFRSDPATTFAVESDRLFFTEVALTVLFCGIVAALTIFLAVRYRRGNNVDRSHPLSHNTLLELSWTIIPLVLAVGVFFWSTKLFADVYAVPPNATNIFVIGKQWMWHLQHENGIRENNELHIPVGEPVKLTMISQDVIHAFYVPEFRIQRHVEPGNYTSFWFQPTKIGKYHLFCNMYCGTQHSEMGGWVYVMSKTDYQKWVATGGGQNPVAVGGYETPKGELSMAQQGAALFEEKQCASCHSPEGVARHRGPSLLGIYGKSRQMTDGRQVTADDSYLRNVMLYPNENVLAGWPEGMPAYKGVLTEEQVLQVNAYVKSLSGVGVGASPAVSTDNLPGKPGAGGYGPHEGTSGTPSNAAPNANTNDIQWRYMYGGEQYQ